jgi:hypothetical protein
VRARAEIHALSFARLLRALRHSPVRFALVTRFFADARFYNSRSRLAQSVLVVIHDQYFLSFAGGPMHTSSDSSTPVKRSRARKADGAPKKPRASKKPAPMEVIAIQSDVVTSEAATLPSADALANQIAITAYFIAAQRNFVSGHELDDWLNAEREVLSRYG